MNDILQLTEFSGFPVGYQYRPSLCREFNRLLTSNYETEILILECRPGIGGTSLCAEYCGTISDPAILLTVHARSRPGYSLPYLLEQALRQAHGILGEEPKNSNMENAVAEWQRTLSKLARKARSARQKIHIIIDGLHQIPREDEKYQSDVIREILFLGNPDVKHILTWGENCQVPVSLQNAKNKIASIPALNDHEALNFLVHHKLHENWHREIIASTGGVPAKLASIVRLHALGKLDGVNTQSSLSEFYEIELETLLDKIKGDRKFAERILSFVAFAKRPLAIGEIAKLAKTEVSFVSDVLQPSGFVDIDPVTEAVTFASNTHRDYLVKRFSENRTFILRSFVDALVENPGSLDSVQLLPTYYNELGEFSQTCNLLTVENLDAFLAETQSITALKQRNDLGFSAATKSKIEVESFRFALQSSIIRSLDKGTDNEPLLAALAAVGRLDEALQVAESESTSEGKLLLLAQYVSVLHKRAMKPDGLILAQIELLIKNIDLAADRDKSIVIAEYLVGPYPDLAFRIVEECSNGESKFKDAAYTHLAINEKWPHKNKEAQNDDLERYAKRISDSKTHAFIKATEAVLEKKSPDDLFESTRGMDGRQRSFFLRQWLSVHYLDSDALRVARAALDDAASDAAYAPSANDLRIICLPLIYSSEAAQTTELLQRIEIQRTSLIDRASTVEKTRLDLAIARAKVSLGQANADTLVEDIYLTVSYLTDDGVKLECFCWLQSELFGFDGLSKEVADSLCKLTEEGIENSINLCLETTAEHVDVFNGAVSALVEFNPEFAFKIIEKINTNQRRNDAYNIFIEKLLYRKSSQQIPSVLINDAIWKITDPMQRWVSIVSCLSILGRAAPKLDAPPTKLMDLCRGIEDPLGIAYAIIQRIYVAAKYGIPIESASERKKFDENIILVDESWRTPRLNFEFIVAVAKIDKAEANKILDDYWRSDARLRAQAPEHYNLLESLCRLKMVSFAGTLRHRQDTEEALQTLLESIGSLSPLQAQAHILSDLAVRAHAANRKDLLDRICQDNIAPLVRNQSSINKHTYRRVIEAAFTALFLWNEAAASSYIDVLTREQKDQVRTDVVHYLITRTPPSEPYDDENLKNARVNWPDSMSIINLIEKLETDNILASTIIDFAFAATSKGSVQEINASQRSEMARRLTKKANESLPDSQNIRHDGWKILAHAACLKLAGDVNRDKWGDLINQAKSIPNTSDSVFILSNVAYLMPVRLAAEKIAAIREAESQIVKIPSRIDSVRRAVSLSRLSGFSDTENDMAKRILRQAMQSSLTLKNQGEMLNAQRSILDQAYKIDEEFAEELVRSIDDDPARMRAISEAKARLAQQKARGAFIEKKYDLAGKAEDFSGMGWHTLASLNAGNVPGQRQEEINILLPKIALHSIDESFGFYWLYLRSIQRRYEHSAPQSKQILVPIMEVTSIALLLAERIGGRVWGDRNLDSRYFDCGTAEDQNYVNLPGSGKSGFEYICQWIEEQSSHEVLICDPYFQPENIDFIKEIAFQRDGLDFCVLSCNFEAEQKDMEAKYRAAWSALAHVEPPPIRVVHLTYEGLRSNSALVIHDRWIFVGNQGLRIGTSMGSLSGTKLYEISRVLDGDAIGILSAIRPFVDMKQKVLDGKRLRYSVFQW